MKLTNWKISKALAFLPEEDRKMVKEEMSSPDGISPENMSRIQKMTNSLSSKKATQTKGAFGKAGTNRKSIVALRRKEFIEKLKQAQEESESKNEESND